MKFTAINSIKSLLATACAATIISCSSLDLSPKDQASTGDWFKTNQQFEMNLNAILLHQFWPQERNEWTTATQCELDALTDDFTNRSTLITFNNGALNGTNPVVTRMWDITYSGISRCNKIITSLRQVEGTIDQGQYDRIMANARFYRACFYSRLLMHFGDVVVVDEDIDIETEAGREATYQLTRSNCWEVLETVLDEFDAVALVLPKQYGASEVQRATQGAAYGMKARTALHFASIRKWDTFGLYNVQEADRLFEEARDAAWQCMQLGAYTLHANFTELFLQKTKNSPEGIFIIPRSKILSGDSKWQYIVTAACTPKLSRLAGASSATTVCPSWDLLCSFLCKDGLPIDESPLYDSHKPFENRDPRCAATIVEFGTQHLGVTFDPSFDVDKVYSFREGKEVANNDSRTYKIAGTSNQYASYNGLLLKKGVDDDWLSPFEVEPDKKLLRYADVLLMYAEAKIELDQIDQSVLDAMNEVRARAYGVSISATDKYPAIKIADQDKMRTTLRTERRMEFAFENMRYLDCYRWRISEKVMNTPNMGLPKKNQALQRAYMDNKMWFHGAVPDIDANGCPDFSKPVKGDMSFFSSYASQLSQRVFTAPKHYLWPIPTTTLDVMPNIESNQGYF